MMSIPLYDPDMVCIQSGCVEIFRFRSDECPANMCIVIFYTIYFFFHSTFTDNINNKQNFFCTSLHERGGLVWGSFSVNIVLQSWQ